MKIKKELAALFTAFLALAAGAEDPAALIQGRATFERQTTELRDAAAAAVADLGKKYRAALTSAQESATSAGDFDGVVALKAEIARFDFDPTLPLPAPTGNHAALTRLAGQFNDQHSKLLAKQKGAQEALAKRYQTWLAGQRAELTRQKKLEDAAAFDTEYRAATSASPAGEAAAAVKSAVPVPAAVPGETTLLGSFETPDDLKSLEVRSGPAVKIASAHATHGKSSLEVAPGNLIATYALPQNWTGHAALEFDVINAGGKPVQLELVIGDDAWIAAQDYWNRHNAWPVLAPGANTVKVDLAELYRGEPGGRNRKIGRNIDLEHIHFMSLTFSGGEPGKPLYLDHVRLVKKAP